MTYSPAQKTDYILVTGASAGLGEAIAWQFAYKGFHLVLTARRKEQLELLASEIKQKHDVKVLVIACDLAKPESATKLFAETQQAGIRVSGLVNNAGFGVIGDSLKHPLETYEAMLQLMVLSCVRLSYLYSPAMIKQGYGWILNVSSLTAFLPASQGAPLYSPIKKFMLDFSQAHHEELKGKGVHVTALCPGLTRTDFHNAEEVQKQVKDVSPLLWMDADLVAQQGVEAVLRGDSYYINGGVNRFFAGLAKILPERVGRWIMGRL